MAKVILTIADIPGGGFTVKTDFDPPLQKGDFPTESQSIGIQIVKSLAEDEGDD